MVPTRRVGFAILAVSALMATAAVAVEAQNWAPNPYRTVDGVWGQLPDGRT